MTAHTLPPLFDRLDVGLAEIDRAHLRRRHRVVSTPCQPHVCADGRDVLAFTSNDYLGLAAHPEVVAALIDGAQRYGAGSGASHLISGHFQAHAELEDALAQFMSPHLVEARALYFCTGYMANLATISALADKDAEIFSEALNHASLIDGARLSRARTQIYPHGDVDALGALLAASTAETKRPIWSCGGPDDWRVCGVCSRPPMPPIISAPPIRIRGSMPSAQPSRPSTTMVPMPMPPRPPGMPAKPPPPPLPRRSSTLSDWR